MKAAILDIDGVILKDENTLPGAKEMVAEFTRVGRPFLFLTNYSSQTPGDLQNRFRRGGIDVEVGRFYTSAMATAEFLDQQAGTSRRAYVIGEGALIHALYQIGFSLVESDADFVVLGETRSYNFEMIQRAVQLIKAGARFVATNPDVAGPASRPSCGALAAPIEKMTMAPFYVGKPSSFMIRAALHHLKTRTDNTVMVGDNMDTDIIAGIQAGMETVLVLTGVSQQADLARYAYRPHHVIDTVASLSDLLEKRERAAVEPASTRGGS